MELARHYLEEVQMIDGVWILRVPDEITLEEKAKIKIDWEREFPGSRIVMIPSQLSISKINRYSYYIALMLINGGFKVTRVKWKKEAGYDEEFIPYLALEKIDGHVVLIKKYPNDPEEDEYYITDKEDLEAEDFVLLSGQ